jgi:hypothetical protein
VTDDRFDDYVDEESISDFAAQDAGLETDADTGIDGAIDEPGTGALPDATGVSSVDAAMAELARLDELPTSEHVAVYEGLHRQLQDALADLDGS